MRGRGEGRGDKGRGVGDRRKGGKRIDIRPPIPTAKPRHSFPAKTAMQLFFMPHRFGMFVLRFDGCKWRDVVDSTLDHKNGVDFWIVARPLYEIHP